MMKIVNHISHGGIENLKMAILEYNFLLFRWNRTTSAVFAHNGAVSRVVSVLLLNNWPALQQTRDARPMNQNNSTAT